MQRDILLKNVALFATLAALSVAAARVILYPTPHYAIWTIVVSLSISAVFGIQIWTRMRRGD